MAKPKQREEQSSFTVTDRRAFNSEGELRSGTTEETRASKPEESVGREEKQAAAVAEMPSPTEAQAPLAEERDLPIPPTSAEQDAQAEAYKQSSKDIDSQVELSGRSAKEFEMTFERFMASLYMTAMMQMGMMRQQGQQPAIDIIGARQTIDTLSLIGEKTKNNLTPVEENFLQNSLYELRMAYVEVTNALARPPHPGPATGTGGR